MPGSVNGINRSLVAGGLVEFEKCPVKVQGFRKIANHFQRNLSDIAKTDKEKPKDHNMSLVGLGNTRILTDSAQESPWTPAGLARVVVIPSMPLK